MRHILQIILIVLIPNVTNAQWTISGNDLSTTYSNIIFNSTKQLNSTLWLGPTNTGSSTRAHYYIKAYDYWGPYLHFKAAGDNGNELMTVTVDGSLGIGTTSPVAKLHVTHTSRMGIQLGGPSSSSGAVSDLIFKPNDGLTIGGAKYWYWSFRTDSWSSAPGDLVLYSNNGSYTSPIIAQADGDLLLTTGNGSVRNGNVGIGTTSPDYKLDVLGTIRANEVKVATGWSDFVFEPDYDLKSLDQVEEFINQNGHLPDIPSAKEVEENGISLGEMDAKLLQKIEELTLYVIELKKSDDHKTKMIDDLKKEINTLKPR